MRKQSVLLEWGLVGAWIVLAGCASTPDRPWEKRAEREREVNWPTSQRQGEAQDPRVPPGMYPARPNGTQ